jgi:UPF0755 protein
VSRTLRSLIILALVLVVLAGLEVFSRFLLRGSPTDTPQKMVNVTIPEGATISEIGTILRDSSIIEHPMLFKYAVRLMGADTKIQAGNIELVTGQSLLELIRRLTRAKAMGAYVTFREGLTSMEIAGILHTKIGIDSALFMSLVRDTQFVRELGLEATSLEGFLFPDTYALTVRSDPRRIAMRMVEDFRAHLPADFEEQAQATAMSMKEVITLASIIQWETLHEQEAPLISSVYHNRLRKHMPLQADPTVAYALGKGPSRLYYSDLQVDSPYNTYRNSGLPPGAINNPGLRAIDAALNPARTDFLFFVAQGDGSHAFTSNLADHLLAKQKLDRLRRENGRLDSLPPDSIRSDTVTVSG